METLLNNNGVVTEKDLKGINLWVNKMVRNEELGTWDPIKFWSVDGINGWVEMPIINEETGRINSWYRRPVEDRRIIDFFCHDDNGSFWDEPYEAESIDDNVMKEWAMIASETLSEAESDIDEIRNSLATKFRIKEARWKREQKKKLSSSVQEDFEGEFIDPFEIEGIEVIG